MATGSNTLTSYYAKRIEDQGIGTNTALTSLDNARVKILSNTASTYDAIWNAKSTDGIWAQIVGPDNKLITYYTDNAASNPTETSINFLNNGTIECYALHAHSLKADWASEVLNTGEMKQFYISPGTTGYVEICQFEVTGAYSDVPFEVGITRRGDITPSYITIRLTNAATIVRGTIYSCIYRGVNCFTVVQDIDSDAETNIIHLWVEKSAAYDVIKIISFQVGTNSCIGHYSFPGTFSETQPTGGVGVYPASQIKVGGITTATMDATSTNPRITFAEKDGNQPVNILYSHSDNYRAPAGLKVIGGADASPAWFEVEGALYTGGKISASGNIDAIGAGEHIIRASNADKGNVDVMLDAGSSGNVGVYAHGYWNGSAYVSNAQWLIYRGSDGKTRLPTSTAGSASIPVYIASGGAVTACGTTMFQKKTASKTYTAPANGNPGTITLTPTLPTGFVIAAILEVKAGDLGDAISSVFINSAGTSVNLVLKNTTSTAHNNKTASVTVLTVNSSLIS